MTPPVKIKEYLLPEGISAKGRVAEWVRQQPQEALQKLDRGDELNPQSLLERKGDKRLGRVELFQGLVQDYERWTRVAVKAGLARNWALWEGALRQKDQGARMIRELGWEPAFHIADRAYQKRIVEIIRKTPLENENSFLKLYEAGMPSWAAGGLCLGYPRGSDKIPTEMKAEETVAACKSNRADRWGGCTQTSRKVAALFQSVLAVYAGAPMEIRWMQVNELPLTAGMVNPSGLSTGSHAFIALQGSGRRIALDPSDLGFQNRSARYAAIGASRGSVIAYYNNLGIDLAKGKKWNEAEAAYRKALAIDSKSPDLWYLLGAVLKEQGKLSEAEAAYQRCLSLNPKDLHAWMSLGSIFADQKKFVPAQEAYRKALKINPREAAVWTGLGLVFMVQKKWEPMERAYRKAVEIQPRDASIWNMLGNALLEQKKYSDAEASLKKSLSLDPKSSSQVWHDLGMVLEKQEKWKETESAYRRALRIDPKNALAWYGLGILFERQGRSLESRQAYRRAFQLNPSLKSSE